MHVLTSTATSMAVTSYHHISADFIASQQWVEEDAALK
jgi:hypothetical protein